MLGKFLALFSVLLLSSCALPQEPAAQEEDVSSSSSDLSRREGPVRTTKLSIEDSAQCLCDYGVNLVKVYSSDVWGKYQLVLKNTGYRWIGHITVYGSFNAPNGSVEHFSTTGGGINPGDSISNWVWSRIEVLTVGLDSAVIEEDMYWEYKLQVPTD